MADQWGPPLESPVDSVTGWSPPSVAASSAPLTQAGWSTPHEAEMPDVFTAMSQGLQQAYHEAEQSGAVLSGQRPELIQEKSPAAQPFAWSDVTSPISQGLPKVGYQLAKSSPTLGLGIAGGVAGSLAGPWGTLIGGAAGAGSGAALQAIGPVFAQELHKTPKDPNGAWDRTVERASTSGLFSALGWAAFPLRIANGPLKQLAFQAFGVQPAISMGEQTVQNVIQGKPATENLGQAYAQGAVGTAVPLAGHMALRGLINRPSPETSLHPTETTAEPMREPPPAAQETIGGIEERMPSPVPEQPNPSWWDRVPFSKQLNGAVTEWRNTFQPESTSELSRLSNGIFRQYNSARAQQKDAIINAYDSMHNAFERMPMDEQINFIKAMGREEGATIPENLRPYANEFRNILELAHAEDRNVGSKLGYVEDYFPRAFVKPEQAKDFILNRIQSLGPKWFQKARTNDLLQQGLDAGLKLRTANPADLVTMRLLSSVDMRERVRMLERLKEIGAAEPIKDNESGMRADDFARAGWRLVNDPIGRQWAIHPEVQPLWNNAIDAKGLWNNEGKVGSIFRGWMNIKNAWVPLKLALSAFHPLHVSHINVVDGFTRGWNRLTRGGDLTGAINSAAKGFYGQVYFPQALAAKKAWITPVWRQTPEQKAVVKLMTEGGFSPQLTEQLRMKGHRAFNDALAHGQYIRAVPYGIMEGFRKAQGLIFEKWIPALKTAAYLDEARTLFERRPDLQNDPHLRKAALGAIAKSIDNRFGEMFYSNLFWNKMLKDASIGSFLSLGWNLGFVREFGGGLIEPAVRRLVEETPTRKAVKAAQNKTAFSLFYFANAMILNALITKAMSGQNPEGMDYFLPRVGGNNPDGSPRRISNMFYTREVPMMIKHVQERGGNLPAGLREMVWNKTMFEPFHEWFTNRDYYGYQIMDENAPWYKQYGQLGKFILSDQLNPITIMGAKRALQSTGKWNEADSPAQKLYKIATEPEGQMALLGFGPAPSYASKSAAQNRLAYLFGEYVSPAYRPLADKEIMEARRDARNQLMLGRQLNNRDIMTQAAKRLHDLGVRTRDIQRIKPGQSDLYLYQRLPAAVQKSFLTELYKDDFKRYYPKSNKKIKADPEIRKLFRKFYKGE